jgi:hypothetical protein
MVLDAVVPPHFLAEIGHGKLAEHVRADHAGDVTLMNSSVALPRD